MAVLVGLATLVSLAALKGLPAPFVWIGLAWLAVAIALLVRTRHAAPRVAAQTVAATIFTVTGVEAYLSIADLPKPAVKRNWSPAPYTPDSLLGWRLTPGLATRASARLGDSVLYDVGYTADSAGNRVSYPDSAASTAPCVVFVVCSFTFGEGVADSETIAYRVGALTHGRVRTVNLGVPGYGMEHWLARLEQNRVNLPCQPTHLVYQALAHHVVRASGGVVFSRRGPRYAIGADGVVSYTGTATPTDPAAAQSGVWFELKYQLEKSRLYRMLSDRQPPVGSLDDIRLYLGIVRRSRDLFQTRYPKAQLHVLAWSLNDTFAGDYESWRDSLATIEPNIHDVRDILPDYRTAPQRYEIHPRDKHPNAHAYDLLARFVVDSILGSDQR